MQEDVSVRDLLKRNPWENCATWVHDVHARTYTEGLVLQLIQTETLPPPAASVACLSTSQYIALNPAFLWGVCTTVLDVPPCT